MALRFDDFNDGSIAAFWSKSGESGGHAWSETGGQLVADLIINGQWLDLTQDTGYTIDTPTDIFLKANLPAGLSAEDYTELNLEVYNVNTDDYSDLYFSHYGGEYYCGANEVNDAEGEDEYEETADLGVTSAWLRMTISSLGFRYYYAIAEPTRENDWTEIVIPMVNPVIADFTPEVTELYLSARSGEGDPPSEQVTVDFMSRWVARTSSRLLTSLTRTR